MSEIFLVFLRLGLLGFGGPIAALGLMEEEACERRKWLERSRFSEILAICKLLPGPVSTQAAIYIGQVRAGALGGIVAGVAFVFPAFLMVLILGAVYIRFAGLGHLQGIFQGMQAAALVVIAISTWRLAEPYAASPDIKAQRLFWKIFVISAALTFFFPRWEPVIILICGLSGAFWKTRANKVFGVVFAGGALSGAPGPMGLLAAFHSTFKLPLLAKLFWVCFKAGAFVFGTGLAIVPLLEGDVVRHYGWLTHAEFMDALAIGQVTPGPVVITATFIGMKTAGLIGSIVATVGMFLPSFVNVLVLVPLIWKRFAGSSGAEGFSGWAIPAVIGSIFAALIKLGVITFSSGWIAIVLFIAGFAWIVLRNPPVWVFIPLSGILGYLASLL